MKKKKIVLFLLIGTLVFIVLFSYVPISNETNYKNQNITEYPHSSASLEGSDNVLVTYINREAELNGYGAVNFVDSIIFKNLNANPINSIFIGVPLSRIDDLIFYEATGEQDNTLLAERSEYIMKDYEMFAIYFETPLLPQQSKEIKFIQTYKDMLIYEIGQDLSQELNFTSIVFPVLPYKAEGNIVARYEISGTSKITFTQNWVTQEAGGDAVTYAVSLLEPFLENLVEEEKEIISITLSDNTLTKLEVNEIVREIHINPFGTVKVKEEYLIKNNGAVSIDELSFEIPGPAKAISVFDDLGEILGVEVDPEENYFNLTYKDLTIDLSENRVKISPDSKFRFNIQYFLPFEKYISLNWFQESV
ncbi:MAG: hypothetical protein ACFFAH_11500, partial [Promethearchaeota archaeon]